MIKELFSSQSNNFLIMKTIFYKSTSFLRIYWEKKKKTQHLSLKERRPEHYLKKSLHSNSNINQLVPVLDEPPSFLLDEAETALSFI